jgi:hypothetical protein
MQDFAVKRSDVGHARRLVRFATGKGVDDRINSALIAKCLQTQSVSSETNLFCVVP